MTGFYVQREAGVRERIAALTIAIGVGGLSFYLAKSFLAREQVESRAPSLVGRSPVGRSPAAEKPARRALTESGRRSAVE